jgi:hypothetical protein
LPTIPSDPHGRPAVQVNCCYAGQVADGERTIAPSRGFGTSAGRPRRAETVHRRPGRERPHRPARLALLLEIPRAPQADRRFLTEQDLYVYTVNAFPYGPFKGDEVKERVYEPDWSSEDRTANTMNVADVLADISPEGVEPTIQSAPLAFRPRVTGPDYVEQFTHNLLRVVAHLIGIEATTGRRVKMALEPEPYCFLETTEETVRYFHEHVYSLSGVRTLAELTGLPLSEVYGLSRRHLGIVFDICHQTVEFEDMPTSLAMLEAGCIPIFKLQEAAALWIPEVTPETVAELSRYTDTICQTTELRNGEITRFLNLEDAIEAWKHDPGPREWRVHFHVPMFLEDLGPFKTTRFAISDALERKPDDDYHRLSGEAQGHSVESL